jgi:hypothetical protein
MRIPGEKKFHDQICEECLHIHGKRGAVDRMTQCVNDFLKKHIDSISEDLRLHIIITIEKTDGAE